MKEFIDSGFLGVGGKINSVQVKILFKIKSDKYGKKYKFR